MHIERIFFQQNFRTNPGIDPFLFATYGIGIFINPGENVDDANNEAERLVNEYIQQHTHYPDHTHIEERVIPVQKTTAEYLADEINSCKEVKVLESYKLIVKNDEVLQTIYDNKLKSLTK